MPPGHKRWLATKPKRREYVEGIGYVEMTDVTDGSGLNWNHPIEPLPSPFNSTCGCRACTNTSATPSAGPAGLSHAFGATIFGGRK